MLRAEELAKELEEFAKDLRKGALGDGTHITFTSSLDDCILLEFTETAAGRWSINLAPSDAPINVAKLSPDYKAVRIGRDLRLDLLFN